MQKEDTITLRRRGRVLRLLLRHRGARLVLHGYAPFRLGCTGRRVPMTPCRPLDLPGRQNPHYIISIDHITT